MQKILHIQYQEQYIILCANTNNFLININKRKERKYIIKIMNHAMRGFFSHLQLHLTTTMTLS